MASDQNSANSPEAAGRRREELAVPGLAFGKLAERLGMSPEDLDRRLDAVVGRFREQAKDAQEISTDDVRDKAPHPSRYEGRTVEAERAEPRFVVMASREADGLETNDAKRALDHLRTLSGPAAVVDRSQAAEKSTVAWAQDDGVQIAPAFQEQVYRAASVEAGRAGKEVGGVMEVDGVAVSSVAYEKTGRGADQRYTLTLRAEGRDVSKMVGLNRESLDEVVGLRNAGAISASEKPVGALEGNGLHYAAGRSPERARAHEVERFNEDAQRNAAEKQKLQADLEKRFLRAGDAYYFRDASQKLAFEDRGDKLVTAQKDARVAQSLAIAAEAKGWSSIKVNGSREFQREVWLEASLRGIQVRGYRPTEQDKAQLQEARSGRMRNTVERVDRDRKPEHVRAEVSAVEGERRKKQREQDYNPLRDDARAQDRALVMKAVGAALANTISNPKTRQAVEAAIIKQVDASMSRGKAPAPVHVYDRSAPARSRDVEHARPAIDRRTERVR